MSSRRRSNAGGRNNTPRQRNRQQPVAAVKTARRRPRTRTGLEGSNIGAYASMIADPCGSALVPGIHGSAEGLLSRFKLAAYNSASDGNCGYVLWCPVYDNQANVNNTEERVINAFTWTHDDPSVGPVNNAATPFGTVNGFVFSRSGTLNDPGFTFVNSSVCADTRLISACMRLTYTGSMFNSSGQIGFIEDMPLHSVISGGAGGNPPSVNELFQHATHTARLGIDTLEVVYQPSARTADIFTQAQDGALKCVPGEPTTLTTEAETLNPKVYGFVWRGLDMPPGDGPKLSYELIKNCEWRPEVSSGLPEVPIVHMGVSKIAVATTFLDRTFAGWTRKIAGAAGTMGTRIAKAAFTGITTAGRSMALNALKGGLNRSLRVL